MTQEKEKIKIYCGTCKQSTNHKVLAQRNVDAPPEDHFYWGESHYFCQCAGCDSYSYAIAEWDLGDFDFHTRELNYRWKTYPKDKSHRSAINDLYKLPIKIRSIYQEIIGAMNAQLPVLTAIGLRALIEAICKDQGIEARNLKERIDGLATTGILSESQASILHSHRFLGNSAAHEITSTKTWELIAALDIAEVMLKTIYIIPELSNQIKTGKKPC
ncbi:DUF4145 domain-containing protein [Picosynechococcus sp. PCC 8807]|uniref:DUF4145 domain-containing protein n=1 Tax=Picosynechococcus sp. PCC 8807 TaxID=195248 RepID=UPI000810631A|nr:DUF4145 domain-containing protein [Picosynechococcus sp. PCC 8807]ANV91002.1 hypothetical protein AWQ24_10335 [Picosynechococcus sp. PCC 8807]